MSARPESKQTRPLKIGLILPETERQMNGGSARWSDLREMAHLGEEIGADSLWITDHLIHRVPGEEPRGMWECWSLIAALAAITERPEIGTLVLCTGFRNPALLAKMADTVEEISDGRLILGLGAGWNEAEYTAFGYPFDHRVSRFEEAVTIITALLREGHVDFAGEFYQARDCELRPRGPRPNGPPIIFGASSAGPRMLDLSARFADGWNAWFSGTGNTVAGLLPLLAKVDAACDKAGRDPATLERSCAVIVEVGPHEPSAMTGPPLSGSPSEIAAGLRAYADAGVSHVQIWLEPNTPDGIEAFAPVLEELDRLDTDDIRQSTTQDRVMDLSGGAKVQVFKDQDEKFLAWKEAHPAGYVVNAYRNPNASYLVLHRADCWHLTGPDLQWTKTYIKICSTEVDDLVHWARQTVPGFRGLRKCKTCKP